MADPPKTRPSLLVRIRDAQDAESWCQFVDVYAPLIYQLGRKRGLQDADAADVTQEVLRAVAGAAGRLEYDPRRGSFRGWLFTVARNKVHDFLMARKRQARGSGADGVHDLLDGQPAREERDQWDREYEQRLFAWAADQVRVHFEPNTWRAFWMTSVDGHGPKEAAKELGLTVGAVYIAKSRVLARLRETIRQLEGE